MLISILPCHFVLFLTLLPLLSCTGSPSIKSAPEAPSVLPGPIVGTSQILLPNGWKLSPVGNIATPFGDLLLRLQISPDGRLAVVVNAGWSEHSHMSAPRRSAPMHSAKAEKEEAED